MVRRALNIIVALLLTLSVVLMANGVTVHLHRCYCHDNALYVSLIEPLLCDAVEAHHHHCDHGCAHHCDHQYDACTHNHSASDVAMLHIAHETECCGCEDEHIELKPLDMLTANSPLLNVHWTWLSAVFNTQAALLELNALGIHVEPQVAPPSPPPVLWCGAQLLRRLCCCKIHADEPHLL